jgi:hypothetical protein
MSECFPVCPRKAFPALLPSRHAESGRNVDCTLTGSLTDRPAHASRTRESVEVSHLALDAYPNLRRALGPLAIGLLPT